MPKTEKWGSAHIISFVVFHSALCVLSSAAVGLHPFYIFPKYIETKTLSKGSFYIYDRKVCFLPLSPLYTFGGVLKQVEEDALLTR